MLSYTQVIPFESEIVAFERADKANGYQEDFLLFTGSSSIRLWSNLDEHMKGYDVLNRGFGGATLSDLNRHWERITAGHNPKLVVVYCGENDIASGRTVAATVAEFELFLKKFDKTFPDTKLIYVAMKPSPSRWSLWPKFREADKQIEALIAKKDLAYYIDLSESMVKNGQPLQKLFIEDDLHMNGKGYKRWKKHLKPFIKSVL